nr:type VII secretion system-associated protein [Streptomyces sp. CBMA152]
MVELFDDAGDEPVVSVEEQRAAYAAWKGSPSAGSGLPPEPQLTPELLAQARHAPGTWLYSIDPAYDPAGQVPPYAIIGAWPVDGNGSPGPFQRNPNYRPSPLSLGLPAPTDAVEAAMQRAATGHGGDGEVVRLLAEATVYLVPGAEPGITLYTDAEGRFVPVLTDPRHAPATAPQLQAVPCRALLASLPADVALKLNPGSRVSVRIPSQDVRAAG